MMKRYLELVGLFAVSGCLALMINSAAMAYQQARVDPSDWLLSRQVPVEQGNLTSPCRPRG
ncbi:MAG TPA: hypothetical protein IGR64_17775 [Leptolyngbyaceae cyanobacterium M65_K2018_010]|nr:hypothetical protein [Leptolyngbyaceae cyanobacterium M65_K2018_010]